MQVSSKQAAGASGNASPVVVGLLLLGPVGTGDGVRVAVHTFFELALEI